MGDVKKMFDNLSTAVVACDADLKVTYANKKCKQMFKASMGIEGFVGHHMGDFHKPETMEKLKNLFIEYKQNKKRLDYYTLVTADGKLTIVNTPYYEGDTFAGVVEFLFEGSLA